MLTLLLNLQGEWSFSRALTSPDGTSLGSVTGWAHWTSIQEHTLHYREQGQFETPHGKLLRVHREYCYIYRPLTKHLEKHFIQNGSPSGLFYVLEFEPFENSSSPTNTVLLQATGHHLCADDHYHATYTFMLPDRQLRLVYDVFGPKKQYRSDTLFQKREGVLPCSI